MELGFDNAKMFTDFHELNQLRHKVKQQGPAQDLESITAVAKQFEALMLQIVFSNMREANRVLQSDLFGGSQMEMYESMFDQQLAGMLSGRFGLADMLVKQLAVDPVANEYSSQEKQIAAPAINQWLPKVQQMATEAVQAVTQTALFADPKDFVNRLWQQAKLHAEKIDLNPKVLLAQAALETGWGQYIAQDQQGNSSFNLFGIKASSHGTQPKVMVNTLEFVDGMMQKKQDFFRAYSSFTESFADYIKLIQEEKRYDQALANASDSEKYLQHIQQAGYATDPDYAEKILNVMQSELLAQLDE